MATAVYNTGCAALAGGAWDGTVKAMLMRTTYAFNRKHPTVAAISSHECSASGYSRKTLSGQDYSVSQAADAGYATADDLAFTGITGSQQVNGLVLFLDTGNDATSLPLLFFSFDAFDAGNLSPFTFVWNAYGCVKAISET